MAQLKDLLGSVSYQEALAALTIVGIAFQLAHKAYQEWRRRQDLRYLTDRLGAEVFTPQELRDAVANYVQADCQNIDPSGAEGWRRDAPVRQPAFQKLDDILSGSEYRHTFILADSGMGKSTLALNFYSRERARRGGLAVIVVPLGYDKADAIIQQVSNKENSLIVLDAFDEDTKAVEDHRARLEDLVTATAGFRHVIVTCRTQFFRNDEEIPKQTGIVRFGPTTGNQSHEYVFHKLYLSPFNDRQIDEYLRRRLRPWHVKKRRAAKDLVKQIGDLSVRPMILSYVEELIGRSYEHRYQVYEQIVANWALREAHRVNPVHLRAFCQRLAREVYERREELGGERLSAEEASKLAQAWDIPLKEWQIRGRSLLNRDADGRLKFAHRSIMEFLYVCEFIRSPRPQHVWTDQIEELYLQIALYGTTSQKQVARRAAGYAPRDVRDRLIREVYHSNPNSLRESPIWLGLLKLEGMGQVDFQVMALGSDGSLLAVSTSPFPNDFNEAVPSRFPVTTDLAALNFPSFIGTCLPPRELEPLKRHVIAMLQDEHAELWTEFGSKQRRIDDGMAKGLSHLVFRLRPGTLSALEIDYYGRKYLLTDVPSRLSQSGAAAV